MTLILEIQQIKRAKYYQHQLVSQKKKKDKQLTKPLAYYCPSNTQSQMITRHITHISDTKLKSTIQLIQLDPQYKFVCINVPEHYRIYLISCDQFAQQLQKSLLYYGKMKLYSSKLAVKALGKIDTSRHNTMSGVTIIKISNTWQKKQFLAYATLQHVHIYEIVCKQQKISVKYIQVIPLHLQTPIIALRFHYSALYLGHFNDDMKIYQIDNKKNLWLECDSIIKMPDQFLRIVMYDDEQGEGRGNYEDEEENEKKSKIIKRNTDEQQYEQEDEQKKTRVNNFQRYHSVNEIMQMRKLQYVDNDNNEQQNSSQQHADIQPYTPVIIYQRNDNSLWKAEYDHQDKKYVHVELCPPMTFECLPIADYDSDEEADDDDDEMGGMMVRGNEVKLKNMQERKSAMKTAGKSVVKNSQRKSLHKTQGKSLRKQSNAKSSIAQQLLKPQQQQQPLNRTPQQPIKISDPLMYRLTGCQNYLIYDTQTTYKILSRSMNWQQIYSDMRQPCVNPFYQQIQRRVYLDMWMSMTNTMYENVFEYLGGNYQFLMVAFADNKMYGNNANPVELTVVRVQLLVVDRIGQMLQNKREQNMDKLRKQMIDLKLMEFDRRWDELNRFYPDDMVKEVEIRMEGNKDIKLSKERIRKVVQYQGEEKSNGDFYTGRYKTPGKEWESQTNHQALQVEESSNGRYNLRPLSRSSKQKNHNNSTGKKKIKENPIKNKNNDKKSQKENKVNDQNKQHNKPNSPTPKTTNPHTYTFPIFEFQYLKSQPFRMQWLSVQQLLFTNEQKRVNYMSIHPNIIYCTIYKIYIDSLCTGVIQSFKEIIDKFVENGRQESELEPNSESEEVQGAGEESSQGLSQYSEERVENDYDIEI